MPRLFVFLTLLIPSFASAQSVYMHEAQEDAANSEPISALGIIGFAIFVGVIYLISKIIGEIGKKRRNRRFEARCEESRHRHATVQEGGFICPMCGKHVLDKNYVITPLMLKGHSYKVKYCKGCNDRYNSFKNEEYDYYRRKEKYKELPTWLSITIFVLLIALGIFVLVTYCMRGEVLLGLWFMFVTPMVVMALLGGVIWLVQQLMIGSKPTKPFETPSLEHIRDCNAIVRRKV